MFTRHVLHDATRPLPLFTPLLKPVWFVSAVYCAQVWHHWTPLLKCQEMMWVKAPRQALSARAMCLL